MLQRQLYQHRRGTLTYSHYLAGTASRPSDDRWGRFISVSTSGTTDFGCTTFGRHEQTRSYFSSDGLDELCYTERR